MREAKSPSAPLPPHVDASKYVPSTHELRPTGLVLRIRRASSQTECYDIERRDAWVKACRHALRSLVSMGLYVPPRMARGSAKDLPGTAQRILLCMLCFIIGIVIVSHGLEVIYCPRSGAMTLPNDGSFTLPPASPRPATGRL